MTKYIKCAFSALYLALSCSILQSAKFVQYLCNSERKRKQSTPSASLVAPVSGGQ